jgi:deoxyribodipyrimidine photo-lyase
MRGLIWFRTDLRVSDNTALLAACKACKDGVVALFIISPGEWRAHDWAPVKVDLVLRTLAELSASLAKLNIALRIIECASPKDIPSALLGVAESHGCDGLFFNREYELNEARRDEKVAAAFTEAGRKVHAYHDQVYAAPGDVRTGGGTYFTVFTPFKKALYAHMLRSGLPESVATPRALPAMVGTPDPVPAAVAGFESHIPASLWPAGEAHARKRLSTFVERSLLSYKARRDFPADAEGTSKLSPYLNIGTISCRQCLHAAIAANPVPAARSPLDSGSEGAVHWISELVWREFYIHIMVGYPRVCMNRAFQKPTESIRWNENAAHFEAWKQGRTGVPIVDAAMRQLATTGFMHNRLRMIAAMYLTKNLFLDWRLGEAFFMRYLVDGFLASNNGGWQWSASTGTDAAPYFRIFNPVSQSRRFDEQGEFIRRYVPELRDLDADTIHEPWTLPGLLRQGLDYPQPLVDLSKSRADAIEAFRVVKGDAAMKDLG